MTPYFIMIALPAIMAFLFGRKNDNLDTKKENAIVTWFFFGALLVLLMLRHTSVGADIKTYLNHFHTIEKLSFKELFEEFSGEYGYWILNKIITIFTANEQALLIILAIITVIPVAILYSKNTENALLTISIFLITSNFDMLFSGFRQAIAITIIASSYRFIKEKKLLPFILIVLVAFLFHKSALIALLIYPIYHVNITKLKLLFFIPFIGAVFIFNKQIFEFMLQFLGEYGEQYQLEETTGYAMIILFGLFVLFAYLAPKDEYMDTETKGLRGIAVLAFTIQIFALASPVAMRINYYNIAFLPLLIPKIINRSSEKNRKTLKLVGFGMTVFFICYYFYRAYTGEDILQLYPYRALWE